MPPRLIDNGAEFVGRSKPKEHPFEALLPDPGIKHRSTRPYRPQTDGKIERFWRGLGEDRIDGTTFENADHVSRVLLRYMSSRNEMRPHQALGGIAPKAFLDTLVVNGPPRRDPRIAEHPQFATRSENALRTPVD